MKRALLTTLIAFTLFSQTAVLAAALTLESIGASTVGGRRISSWTYTGTNPIFSGTADPSATVTITIDGTANTATADASGAWTFTPTKLGTEGSYPVTIASGTESLSFTLAIGASSVSETTTTKGGTTSGELVLPDELPQSGGLQQTVLLMGSGLGLVLAGVLFYWKIVPKLLFEVHDSSTIKPHRP